MLVAEAIYIRYNQRVFLLSSNQKTKESSQCESSEASKSNE